MMTEFKKFTYNEEMYMPLNVLFNYTDGTNIYTTIFEKDVWELLDNPTDSQKIAIAMNIFKFQEYQSSDGKIVRAIPFPTTEH